MHAFLRDQPRAPRPGWRRACAAPARTVEFGQIGQPGRRHHLAMHSDRPNRALSADVELALLLVDLVGARLAANFLMQRGADFALTCRVLVEPARRRARSRAD